MHQPGPGETAGRHLRVRRREEDARQHREQLSAGGRPRGGGAAAPPRPSGRQGYYFRARVLRLLNPFSYKLHFVPI